jgi:glycosyltransferase involved in cell wall biosynthesis
MGPLNVLHVLRAPVGGLFRHVIDLARGQIARGHRVGLIADLRTGGPRADEILSDLAPQLVLGLTRIAMPRQAGLNDIWAVRHVSARIAGAGADVIHGHGAKGGAYARLARAPSNTIHAYTPHGGSLHYNHNSLTGYFYLTLERILMQRGDLLLFESTYSADAFRAKVGDPAGCARVVHNGVAEAEFAPVPLAPGATDLVFIGELRLMKGVDLLIEAISLLHQRGRRLTATLVGSGPDAANFRAQVTRLKLDDNVRFKPTMPARAAMALGRIMVVPSRAESLPYVVLEAAAAEKPLIATRVGGIPEIYGPLVNTLVPTDNASALADTIVMRLDDPAAAAANAEKLRALVAASFSVAAMVDGVLAGYQAALSQAAKTERR